MTPNEIRAKVDDLRRLRADGLPIGHSPLLSLVAMLEGLFVAIDAGRDTAETESMLRRAIGWPVPRALERPTRRQRLWRWLTRGWQ